MIRYEYDDSTKVARTWLVGKTTPSEYKDFTTKFGDLIKRYGKIYVLLDLQEWNGWSGPWALLKHIALVKKYHSSVPGLAAVGNKKWKARSASQIGKYVDTESQYFDILKNPHAEEDANRWLIKVKIELEFEVHVHLVSKQTTYHPLPSEHLPIESKQIKKPKKSLFLFTSYSHRDMELLNRLKKSLKLLEKKEEIYVWTDKDILPSEDWSEAIEENLKNSQIILLLISDHFFASCQCNREMERAIDRHVDGKARVLPIIAKPSYWKDKPIARFQVLPTNAIPVTDWDDEERAWDDVIQGIQMVINQWRDLTNRRD